MNWTTSKEYLPLLSICIILSGLIRQLVYYSHFGIEIQYYISVSELFLVLCNKLTLMLYIPLIAAALVYTKYDIPNKSGYYTLGIGIVLLLLFIFVFPSDPFVIGGIALMTLALIYPAILHYFDIYLLNTTFNINTFHRYFHTFSIVLYFIIIVILQANRDIYNTEK